MKDLHGMIFAYSSNVRLKELTEHRTATSIPFGGRYRVIDFMLSNMVNAGITNVGVIMRESYQSLLDHLGSGKDWDLSRKRGGLKLLPPFGYAGVNREAFRGHMEALFGVTSYVNRIRQEYVALGDGDLVTNISIERVFASHLKSGADITCVCTPKHFGSSTDGLAYFKLGVGGRINGVVIGCPEPETYQSMRLCIMSKRLLDDLMSHCAAHNLYSLQRDVLQQMCDKLNISAYVFDGYCCDLSSIPDYYKHSMELLDTSVRKELFNRERPIKTKVRDEASTYYGEHSNSKNSVVADGCYIEGSVENCLLFRGVRVDAGAKVKNCILMQDTHICQGAELSYAITDKEVILNKNRTLMGHETYPIAISKGSSV